MFKSLIRNTYTGEEFELVEQEYDPDEGMCAGCAFNRESNECGEAPDLCSNGWRARGTTVKVWQSVSH